MIFRKKVTTMATTTTTQTLMKPPRAATAKLVCFSFAAYAKTLIDHLKSLNVPIFPGLSDQEFSSIESTFHFTFPPDLRSILQEGLPLGPLFPNWRSSSLQQLHLLLSLPSLYLSKIISLHNFWVPSWGDRPLHQRDAAVLASQFLDKAPVLVPIYWNCYIPSTPNCAGNPVFYIDDSGVRILSFDVARFFQESEFLQMGVIDHAVLPTPTRLPGKERVVPFNVPAWAATAPRRIEFWTDVAERGRRIVAREPTRGWWSGGGGNDSDYRELRRCLEEVFWRLRDGGWREEEVREMMMMMDGSDHRIKPRGPLLSKQDVALQVRVLSVVLLRAGWSREDVVHSLDLHDDDDDDFDAVLNGKSKSFLDLPLPNCRPIEDGDHQKRGSIKRLMSHHSLGV